MRFSNFDHPVQFVNYTEASQDTKDWGNRLHVQRGALEAMIAAFKADYKAWSVQLQDETTLQDIIAAKQAANLHPIIRPGCKCCNAKKNS